MALKKQTYEDLIFYFFSDNFHLDKKKFSILCMSYPLQLTDQQIQDLFALIDARNSKSITKVDFKNALVDRIDYH